MTCGHHDHVLGRAQQPLRLEQALQLAQQETLALRDRRGTIVEQCVDRLRERDEVEPDDAGVIEVRDRGWRLNVWGEHEEQLLLRAPVEHPEVLTELSGADIVRHGLHLEEVVKARGDRGVRHRPIAAGLVDEAHHLERRFARGRGEQLLDPTEVDAIEDGEDRGRDAILALTVRREEWRLRHVNAFLGAQHSVV